VPRFFFDIDDGQKVISDLDGAEFPSVKAARREAAQALAEMAKDLLPNDGTERKMSIRVRDHSGQQMLHVTLDYTVVPPV
jgi:hypothetical protein